MLVMVAAKGLIGAGDAATGRRVRWLRMTLGFHESKIFADYLGVGRQRWNAFENGASLSKEVAFLLKERTRVSLDWLWYGETEGLPPDLAERLTGFPLMPRGVSATDDPTGRTPRRGRRRSQP